jgi:hypothetical protein
MGKKSTFYGYTDDELLTAYRWLGREPSDTSLPINVKLTELSMHDESVLRAAILKYLKCTAEITPLPKGGARVCVYGDQG